MMEYPKVWRHDHPLLEGLLDSGDIHILEKVDGSNFRFFLYDESYASDYTDCVQFPASDGDVVYGSKSTLRARLDDPLDEVDGNFWRAVRHLREILDPHAIRSFHAKYGPLVFFAENMVCHSLDYEWDSVPPLVGFDVYAPRLDSGRTPFDGFLPLSEAREVIEGIGLSFAPVLDSGIPSNSFEPSEYEVPASRWRDGVAEGVIIRNDSAGARGKLVTAEFRERNADRWGMQKSDAADDTELLVATYCTNARIRKNVYKLVQTDSHPFEKEIIEPLYQKVVQDIWEEEWAEIIQQDWTIEMRRVWPLVAHRCAEVVEVMLTNADLNEAPPHKLWTDSVPDEAGG